MAISSFVKYGIPIYIPFGDNERADLIAEFNGKLNKIQVKTSVSAKDGKVSFDLTSSTMHRRNGVKHKYTKDEIDYFYCYNIEREKGYLIEVSDYPISAISIRYLKPKNNQEANINFECDYLFDNVIKKYINYSL